MGFAYNSIHDHQLDGISCARKLLKKDESEISERVKDALLFLDNLGIWYMISRNSPATSCRDAASRRNRLGNEKIPLSDELRSACMVFYDLKGERHYVILNCRATNRFDYNKVHKLLNGNPARPLARLSSEELKRVFSSEYGTVCPFINMKLIRYQIFDNSVYQKFHPPYTMMTNAGSHTWGVEFYPGELVTMLKEKYPNQIIVNDICESKPDQLTPTKPVFGIITGNGPESGMSLWNYLTQSIRENIDKSYCGDFAFPEVLVNSVPEMGLSMELSAREEIVWQFIEKAIRKLCNGGVTHIGLACHTTHYYTQKIRNVCKEYNVIFVSMAETVINYITKKQYKDITVIGIPYVSDLGKWSAYKELSSFNILPMNEIAGSLLLEIGYHVKKFGSDVKGLNMLNHILKSGVSTKNVLIALTEISVLLSGFPKKKKKIGQWNIIDPLELYGQELAKIYIDYMSNYSDLTIE